MQLFGGSKMKELIENKINNQINDYFFYFFIWGYFYFSAGYFYCKKIKDLFSNEFYKVVPCI